MLDENLLLRVLDNLISNAIRFSPPNGTITIHLCYGEHHEHGQETIIHVADEGPGVPPAQRERIFNEYEIVNENAANLPQLGLGLALCKAVVEAHDGRIFVTDNKPHGADFVVQIADQTINSGEGAHISDF